MIFGERGRELNGKEILRLDSQSTRVEVDAGSKVEYAKASARECARLIRHRGCDPRNVAIDVSADGGIIAQALMQELNSTEILLVSSSGKPSNMPVSTIDPRPAIDVYDRRVTELWMALSVAVDLGIIRNYNCFSRYSADHFTRLYESGSGGKIAIQTKDEFRDMNRRSPDAGDAVTYLWERVRMDGIELSPPVAGERPEVFDPWHGGLSNKLPVDEFESSPYGSFDY